MSPTIDLGVNYDDVKDSDQFPVAPAADYEFTVQDVEQTNAKSGRPMLNWKLSIINPDTNKPMNIFHRTVLPWIPPGETSINVSGVFGLVGTCKGCGLPWEGGSITTENYIGRGGTVRIKQKPKQVQNEMGEYVNDPNGEMTNEVDKFIY